jgi:hypothetical protein
VVYADAGPCCWRRCAARCHPGGAGELVIRNVDPSPRIASRLPFPVEIRRVSVRGETLRIFREGG